MRKTISKWPLNLKIKRVHHVYAQWDFHQQSGNAFFLQEVYCGYIRWQDTQICRTVFNCTCKTKCSAKGNASANNPNHPAVAKHVNTALRHVIRSSVCKHASKACDSADDILRSRRTANQNTGVCALGGASLLRCGKFDVRGIKTLYNWENKFKPIASSVWHRQQTE